MSDRFQGKVAIVTGAASGLGEATAKRFAAEGASVVIADINEEGSRRVEGEIVAAGGRASACKTDVSIPDDVQAMVQHAAKTYGRLDILHNNAFAMAQAPIAELSVEGWNLTIAVTLTAVFLGTKFAIPVMLQQGGGAIVNTASVAGFRGDIGRAAYNASKAAVINLTQTTAIEYSREGIRCNCVCPGAMLSPPLKAFMGISDGGTQRPPGSMADQPDEAVQMMRDRMTNAYPIGRFAELDEIANVVLFLASDEASYVTGAAFVADGGKNAQPGGLSRPQA
jgi:meso-butanediol dehydrogenase/(S,S)-butanediol dehydrogenase/diacetyl reductase